MNHRIVKKEKLKMVGVREWTTPENGRNFTDIPKMWDNMPKEKYAQLSLLANTELTGILGVCGEQENGGFYYWIAAATTEPCPPDLDEMEIPAATWAVFESIGPMPDAIQKTWKYIFSEWFHNSGYEHVGVPDFEWYSDGDVQSEDYKSEVWIPVKEK